MANKTVREEVEKEGEKVKLATKIRQAALRVINNFGMDFKTFLQNKIALEVIKELLVDDETTQASIVEQRDAILTLKSLSFKANQAQMVTFDKIFSDDLLIRILEEK